MNYKSLKIPFLNDLLIKNEAEKFRRKYEAKEIPVDIEEIIDLKLSLDIIPVVELQRLCDTDAFIASDWRSLYVDKDKFLDERFQNRLRFSFSHEIGHLILHKNIYDVFDIKSVEDYLRFIEQIPQEQYSYLETQANKFAGHLLAPRERLMVEREKIIKTRSGGLDLSKVDKEMLNQYLAIPLSEIFGVSQEVIAIILK